ncbi:MAG TPA: cyclic nucleotide-binding domain-containing protein [Holophaga sp.]|nr:cyclic nucleotide-binding domain-containing protein [Holophaga sp.]
MPDPFDPASLEGTPVFPEAARLLSAFPDIHPLRFRDGEPLVREGETSREIFLALRGALVVEQGGGAAAGPLALITCGPEAPVVVGEMAYLGSFPRTATVRSSGATLVLRMEPAHLDAVLEGYPALTRIICRQFAERLRETNQALKDLQDKLALRADRRLFTEGEVLFRAGEPAHTLFQLGMGLLRVETPEGVRELKPEDLPEGYLELGPFLRGGTYGCTATVASSAFCAVLEATDREAFVRRNPALALDLLKG